MAVWILVIIGLDICILLHYVLKYTKNISRNNEKLLEELQRSKFEVAQIAEELRNLKSDPGQA